MPRVELSRFLPFRDGLQIIHVANWNDFTCALPDGEGLST